MSIIQDCQFRIFSDYKALRSRESETRSNRSEPRASSPTANAETGALSPDQEPDAVDGCLQIPVQPVHTQAKFETKGRDNQPKHPAQRPSWDSSYGSHDSASGSSLGEDLSQVESRDCKMSDLQHQMSNHEPIATITSGSSIIARDNWFESISHQADGAFFSMGDMGHYQDSTIPEFFNWDYDCGIDGSREEGSRVVE
jgi:hypothetical protein